MPQFIGTREEKMEAAIAFLLNYREQYGYFPQGQALGRFCLTLADTAAVWDAVRNS